MPEKIVNDIYKVRSEKKMTQEELAKAVGVTRQTIISIEKGNYTPSVHLALKFAEVFTMPVEKLFKIKYEK